MRSLALAMSILLCARAYAEPQLEKIPSPRRVTGKFLVVGGAGLVVTGVALGFYANYKYEQTFEDPDGSGPKTAPCGDQEIDGHPACTPAGHSQAQRARTIGTTGTVVAVVGLAALATGVVLWATAPPDETRVVPTASPSGGGVAIVGTF
jgi:uncharacterized membrane protein